MLLKEIVQFMFSQKKTIKQIKEEANLLLKKHQRPTLKVDLKILN